METAELLVSIFGYPLWFAKLLYEHFPPNFTITEEMEENWIQVISGHLSCAKEKIKDNPNLAGFLEPCPSDDQLLNFVRNAGRCEESELIRIHTFFCHYCAIKYSRLIWEEAILEGLRSIQQNECPQSSLIFGHFHFMMKNPNAFDNFDSNYKRIKRFGYPKFMFLVMDHINKCWRCHEEFKELQRTSSEMEEEDKILQRIEVQLKNIPPN